MDATASPAPLFESHPAAPPGAGPGAVARPPVAVVAVSVPAMDKGALRAFLAGLAASRTAGAVPVAEGGLAVLVLAEDPEGMVWIVEALSAHYPFPLRVEAGTEGWLRQAGRAAGWAAALDVPDAPVLLADVRSPVAPRWAHELLSALRDGADLVSKCRGPVARLIFGSGTPVALSGQARRAMEGWSPARPTRLGAAWARRVSPWREPGRAGLSAVQV